MTSVFAAIVAKEWTCLIRDGRLRGAALVYASLLVVALASGWHSARAIEASNAKASAAERARWVNQGKKWAHSAAHYGVYAFRPAGPLAQLDPGIGPYIGTSVWLEAHWQNETIHRAAQDATFAERLGTLSAAVVLEVCLPLLVILLAFGTIAAEREGGTLRLALAQGVSLRMLAAGKATAVMLAAVAATMPVLVAGWMLSVATVSTANWASAGRFSFWLLGCLTYLALLSLLAVAVSTLTKDSRTALVLLLAAWAAWCVVLPRALPELAAAAEPLPTRQAFARTLASELHDAEGTERVDAVKARLLAEHKVSRVEDLPVNWTGVYLQESEERGNALFDRHFGELYDALSAQQRFASWSTLAAPPLALRFLSAGMAGTDLHHHRAFVDAAESHRRKMQRQLNDEITRNPDRDGKRHLSDEALWRSVPAFRYEEPALTYALRKTAVLWQVLVLWLGAAVVLFQLATRDRESVHVQA